MKKNNIILIALGILAVICSCVLMVILMFSMRYEGYLYVNDTRTHSGLKEWEYAVVDTNVYFINKNLKVDIFNLETEAKSELKGQKCDATTITKYDDSLILNCNGEGLGDNTYFLIKEDEIIKELSAKRLNEGSYLSIESIEDNLVKYKNELSNTELIPLSSIFVTEDSVYVFPINSIDKIPVLENYIKTRPMANQEDEKYRYYYRDQEIGSKELIPETVGDYVITKQDLSRSYAGGWTRDRIVSVENTKTGKDYNHMFEDSFFYDIVELNGNIYMIGGRGVVKLDL